MPQTARTAALTLLVALTAILGAVSANPPVWHVYSHHAGTFIPSQMDKSANLQMGEFSHLQICPLAHWPPSWQVLAALQTDLTRDGAPECTLLVWRPWQDWPIMRWSDTPSPIAANRDAHGDSAHIILVEAPNTQYREIWAGSALALPIFQIAVGDVDGDGWQELVALEGDYATGRYGPARHVAVWRWNGFGFTLAWRSRLDRFVALALADLDGDGVVEILVR